MDKAAQLAEAIAGVYGGWLPPYPEAIAIAFIHAAPKVFEGVDQKEIQNFFDALLPALEERIAAQQRAEVMSLLATLEGTEN